MSGIITAKPNECPILPDKVWMNVASNLHPKDLCSLSETSTQLARVVEKVWRSETYNTIANRTFLAEIHFKATVKFNVEPTLIMFRSLGLSEISENQKQQLQNLGEQKINNLQPQILDMMLDSVSVKQLVLLNRLFAGKDGAKLLHTTQTMQNAVMSLMGSDVNNVIAEVGAILATE